jgi:hypothetical protein
LAAYTDPTLFRIKVTSIAVLSGTIAIAAVTAALYVVLLILKTLAH